MFGKKRGRIGYLGCLFILIAPLLLFFSMYLMGEFTEESLVGGFSLGVFTLCLIGVGIILMLIPMFRRGKERAEDAEAERLARIALKAEKKIQEMTEEEDDKYNLLDE